MGAIEISSVNLILLFNFKIKLIFDIRINKTKLKTKNKPSQFIGLI